MGSVERAADGLRQLQLHRASPDISPGPLTSPCPSPRPDPSPPPPILGRITEEPTAKVMFKKNPQITYQQSPQMSFQKNPQISVTDETGGQFLLTSSDHSPDDASMETSTSIGLVLFYAYCVHISYLCVMKYIINL